MNKLLSALLVLVTFSAVGLSPDVHASNTQPVTSTTVYGLTNCLLWATDVYADCLSGSMSSPEVCTDDFYDRIEFCYYLHDGNMPVR